MKPSLGEILMKSATIPSFKEKDISIDDFMRNVLPAANSIKMLVSNKHLGNFVSLTAPAVEDTKKLFKWENDFAWSYDGEVADSIKERVKAAGGRTEGVKLRVSLAWFNYDDLDISAVEPCGRVISFRNKAGVLDVDMNAGGGSTREAVENLSWKNMHDGIYHIWVHNFCARETIDTGFDIEIAVGDSVPVKFRHNMPLKHNDKIEVAVITVHNGEVLAVKTPISGATASKTKWGIQTEKLTKVETVMYSPNYWDGQATGNKHWLFMLEGCKNDKDTRGIYNEFLRSDLEQHRKVFEVLGEKTKCKVLENGKLCEQLSGLGFSSTRKDVVKLVVNEKLAYNVSF